MVVCRYCESECHVVPTEAREAARKCAEIRKLVKESERMRREFAPRIAALRAKLERAMKEGDNTAAVYYFEGIMRLETLPVEHVNGYDYLNEVIRPAARDFAERLGVPYGS